MLFCMSSALIAGTAIAQNDPATPPGSGSQTGAGSVSGRDYGRLGVMHRGTPVQASKLMGASVKSSTGDNLGNINDFIVNPMTGRIEFGVLSLSNPAGTTPTGAGEKLTPIPWRLLNFNSSGVGGVSGQQYTFTANLDQSKLASAPSFDRNQWPDFSQSDWSQKIYSHYGISWRGEGTGGTGTGTGSSTDQGAGASGLPPKGTQ